jgi:hypothetical protein
MHFSQPQRHRTELVAPTRQPPTTSAEVISTSIPSNAGTDAHPPHADRPARRRSRPSGRSHECPNPVTGFPAPVRVLCRLTRENRQPCHPVGGCGDIRADPGQSAHRRPLTYCSHHDAKRVGSGEDVGALILVSCGMAATRWLTAAVGGGAVLYVFDYDHVL